MKKSNILLYSFIVVLIILVLAFSAVMGSDSFACVVQKWFGTENKKETLQFLGWIISGVIGFLGLFVFYGRVAAQDENNRLIEKGHVQDRFKAAIDHLSNKESVSGRTASFYELYYLARDNKDAKDNYAQTVLDILCAHLRYVSNTEAFTGETREELCSLVDVLFEPSAHIFHQLHFYLPRLHLPGMDFRHILIPQKINFAFSDLRKIVFAKGASLEGADFTGTNLQEAELQEANLKGSILTKAGLLNANLIDANLQLADLREARLRGAVLRGANLHQADLRGADLREASSREVDLSNVRMLPNFSGEYLPPPDLSPVVFRWADLRETKNLQTAKLSGAKYGSGTQFPEGFNPEEHGMELCLPYSEDKK